MKRIAWSVAVLVLVATVGIGALLAFLPMRARGDSAAAVSDTERAQVLAALKPPKRSRPLVAVLASNRGTETTDFVVPLGVLRASDAFDVVAVAARAEEIPLMPALRMRPDQDLASFDTEHPDGADYVVVPAFHDAKDPVALDWLRKQSAAGATVVGICDGAWVVGNAGLLDGRQATTHWYSRDSFRKTFPAMSFTPDRRYVVDRGVATTTGISASIPLSLTLIEATAGRDRADEVAAGFGVTSYGPEHVSGAWALDRRAVGTAAGNLLAFWRYENVDVPMADGVDEVALALTADAWARTYRASVRSVAPSPEVTSRNGLHLVADETSTTRAPIALPPPGASAIDSALDGIAARYGAPTADFVALQLEYDRPVKRNSP
jgi:putative intracellular protease/amidase